MCKQRSFILAALAVMLLAVVPSVKAVELFLNGNMEATSGTPATPDNWILYGKPDAPLEIIMADFVGADTLTCYRRKDSRCAG